jgi:hypothetical protein
MLYESRHRSFAWDLDMRFRGKSCSMLYESRREAEFDPGELEQAVARAARCSTNRDSVIRLTVITLPPATLPSCHHVATWQELLDALRIETSK